MTPPVALVTGASRGIGAATALALAERGHDLLVHFSQDRDGAEKTAAACGERGVQATLVKADLAEEVSTVIEAMDTAGGVGVLVNNAGVTADGIALAMGDEAFARTWQINVAAAFSLCRAAMRTMVRSREGRIVNVSSVVGLHGNAGQANYAASKAALVGLTKSLAREVGKRGITVNAVAPGFIDTAMTQGLDTQEVVEQIPADRMGTAEEVAAAIAFLCSPEAGYINGAVLQVDGGLFA